MKRCPCFLAAFVLALAWAGLAEAQPNAPRIGYVYPAGSRKGAELELVIGGRNIDGIVSVYVSGTGIQTFAFGYSKPKDAPTAAIAESVTVRTTIAADAPAGPRELRLETPSGLTNPLTFWVGQLPEFREKTTRTPTKTEMDVTLPAILNGRVLPGEVDRYHFHAKKGQKLVFAASARDLIPYLPDAVPGWFQAVLALYDDKGNELEYDDDFRFSPDPVLYYEVPRDGQYVIEIRDALYRGREDFVYRLACGELPFIKNIFPLGGPVGQATRVELTGWNLPSPFLSLNFPEVGVYPLLVRKQHAILSERKLDLLIDSALDSRTESVSSTESISNRVPFAVDSLPECLEREPNDSPATAQDVTLPIIVNGRIARAGDWDVFRFQGKAGEAIVAEVRARRLNSPLDSLLRLTDSAGKQIAFNDDHDDKGAALVTHQADSLLSVTLPADGTYFLHLGDTQHEGGSEYAYRLRISHPLPDFDLRIVPSSLNVHGGGTVPLRVFALRKDGYAGDIELSLKDPPPGFSLAGARVPAGQDVVRLTLTAPNTLQKDAISLSLIGRASLGGREVVRPVVPAEDMLQAFAYHHVVPVGEFKALVSGRAGPAGAVRVLGQTPIRIPAGGTATFRAALFTGTSAQPVYLELDEPPDGLSIKDQTPGRDGSDIVIECDAAKIKPGLKGNLIANAFAISHAPPEKGKGKAATSLLAQRRSSPLGIMPATPFEIVAK